MSKYASFILIVFFCCSTAGAQPAIIPRIATAAHNPARTYSLVNDYLSDPSTGLFSIVRTDPAAHLVIAKRSGIDTQNWSDWAYCKLAPDQMLDTLEDGTVTLTVKISSGAENSSNVSVTADFKGTYGLAGNETTAQCISKGVLENRVLQAVGAKPLAS